MFTNPLPQLILKFGEITELIKQQYEQAQTIILPVVTLLSHHKTTATSSVDLASE